MKGGSDLVTNIQSLNFVVNPAFFVTFGLRKSGFYVSKFQMLTVVFFLPSIFLYKVYFVLNNPGRKFEDYVENYGSLIPHILCLLSSLGYAVNSKAIVKTLNQIISKTSIISDKVFLRKVFYVTLLQVFVYHAFPIASVVWTNLSLYENSDPTWNFVMNNCLEYFFWLHFGATSLLFSNVIFYGRRVILKINQQLQRTNQSESEKPETPADKLFVKQEKINHIRVVASNEYLTMTILNYDRVCEWCLDLNEKFGAPLAACCICNLIDMIVYSYYLTKYGVFELWMYAVTFSFSFFQSWTILSESEKFRKEVQNTGIIVNRLVMETKSENRKELLQQFSMLLLHRKMKFTAMGLFYLDYKLIYSALATVATYLAIAFQFEYTGKPNPRNSTKNLTTTKALH